jgi:outer membrane protein
MRRVCWLCIVWLAGALVAAGAQAGPRGGQEETLEQAMAAALRHHPSLSAEAARRAAAAARVDAGRAGYSPKVVASGDVGAAVGGRGLVAGDSPDLPDRASSGDSVSARWRYSLSAEQSIYDGYRTRSTVREAEAGHEAADAQVAVTRQLVLMEAVGAFADLQYARDVDTLRAREVAALASQVASTVELARQGDTTETEVARARARHAQAIADLIAARAEVAAAAAEYARVTGGEPRRLVRPRPLDAKLPASLQAVVASALSSHPMGAVAGARASAARHAIDRQRADGLPQVKLRGGVDGEHGLDGSTPGRDGASVAVRVSVPLFDGGETAARVRQAEHTHASLAEEARGVRGKIEAAARAAWSRLVAARERLGIERDAAAESRRALDGLRVQVKAGQRSVTDELDLSRDTVTAEVRLAAVERDLLVASYAVLAAAGQLSGEIASGVPAAANSGSRRSGWDPVTVTSRR